MEESFHDHTEQLIERMVTFLYAEPEESKKTEKFEKPRNPISCAIKHIVEMFPPPTCTEPQETTRRTLGDQLRSSHIEKACRYKDPYMQEVNRLMFCSTMGHPPNGSPEYFKAAENYALYGKEFLDFPTDIKFPQPMDVSCFGDVSLNPCTLAKFQNPSGIGVPLNKCSTLTTPSVPQQPVLVNHTNYCNFPFFQTPNVVQPLIYSNPFLMSQYLNMFVRETQINTSIVQQQQLLTGGMHERLVYAQMLQHQIQTNQAALMSYCLVRKGTATATGTKYSQEMTNTLQGNGWDSKEGFDSIVSNFDKCDLNRSLTLEE